MTLTQEQIKKISKDLSKLSSSNEKIGEDLNNILKYFDLLNEVNTDNVKPTYSVMSKKSKLRKDEINQKDISRKDILECSNQQVVNDMIAISNIMK